MSADSTLAADVVPVQPDNETALIDYADLPPLLPDGEYRAVFAHHETAMVFKTQKVFLWFRVVDPGPYFQVMLYRAYRVKALKGKPGCKGRFVARRGGDFLEMLFRVLNMRPGRPDRVSLRDLRHAVLKIKVRSVTTDYRQRPLPEGLRYSVVDDIVGFETERST